MGVTSLHGVCRWMPYLRHVLLCSLTIAAFKLYLHHAEGGVGALPACLAFCSEATISTILFIGDMMREHQDDSGILADKVAVKRAKAIAAGRDDFRRMRGMKKVKFMAIASLPPFLLYAMVMVYVAVIFAAFRLFDSVFYKLFITLVAFLFKVGGNKVRNGKE